MASEATGSLFFLSFQFFLKGYYRTVDGPVFSSVWFLVASVVQGERRAELARAMLSRSPHSPLHPHFDGKGTPMEQNLPGT